MMNYNDGIGVAETQLNERAIIKKPFKNAPRPDVWARLLFRDYLVNPKSFSAKIDARYSWTNLALQSEQLDDASWTKTNASVSANAATSPAGTVTADKLIESGATGYHRISQALTVASGALTAGVALKADTRSRVRVSLYNSTDNRFAEVSIDLSSVTTKAIHGSVVRVNALEDGWVYVAISGTATVANSSLYIETETNDTLNSYAGDGASAVLVWRPTVATGTSAPPLIDTAGATRTISAPLLSEDDPLAFLCEETDVTPEQDREDIGKVQRVFARIPADQIRRATTTFTKPAFPTNDYAGAWADSTATNATANIWAAVSAVSAVARFITGGTFTVSYRGVSTGALNYNDSNATIAAAINALSSMTGESSTVTATNSLTAGSLTITQASGALFDGTQLAINSGSLTPTAISSSSLASNAATFFVARTSIIATKTAHGLIAGQRIRYLSATTGGGTETTVETVVDADHFTVANASASSPPNFTYIRTFIRSYTPGLDNLGARVTKKFYWPGLQDGIVTDEDIPIPTPGANDTQFLTALVNGTSYLVYSTTTLSSWRDDGPIYVLEQTEISMGDV